MKMAEWGISEKETSGAFWELILKTLRSNH
jgi:hypothetical protein